MDNLVLPIPNPYLCLSTSFAVYITFIGAPTNAAFTAKALSVPFSVKKSSMPAFLIALAKYCGSFSLTAFFSSFSNWSNSLAIL